MTTKRNCRIAALQMVSGPSVPDNLAAAGRLVEEAVGQGAQLLVLP
jgi:predicted amidohydrolase